MLLIIQILRLKNNANKRLWLQYTFTNLYKRFPRLRVTHFCPKTSLYGRLLLAHSSLPDEV